MTHSNQNSFDHAHPVTQFGRMPSLPVHSARQLTQGGTQARIELDGKIYDLRITRAGKLILTK